jgi:hypothetical protein
MKLSVVVLLLVVGARPAASQSIYTAEVFRDLPAGGNLFALLEAAQPEVTTDRFNSGGLNGGAPDKIGAFLGSWSQTSYRVGDVPIASPVDGTPMLFPELAWWNKISVATGVMPVDSGATALAISLDPMTPTDRWTATLELGASGGALSQAGSSNRPPAIQALDNWSQTSAIVSGRLLNGRLGLLLGGARTASTTIERNHEAPRVQTGSVFANMTFALSPSRTINALTWISDSSVHAQATLRQGEQWRVFSGFTERTLENSVPVSGRLSIDRLAHGPVPILVDRGGHERRVIAGMRGSRQVSRHALNFGGDAERMSYGAAPTFTGAIEEKVNGVPARIWHYSHPGSESRRSGYAVNAFVSDRLPLTDKITLDASLRFESTGGSAEGAAQGIQWNSLLPGFYLHWDLGTAWQMRLVTGFSRSADQLKLGLLAYGDPGAATANVYQWQGSPLNGAPIVGRVGPGTGGDAGFVQIDPDLKRPIMDQFALGIEARLYPKFLVKVFGLGRRHTPQIHVFNQGVPLDGYSTFAIPDANADLLGPEDDQMLTIYNRRPEMYGADRYILTNPDVMGAGMGSVVVSGELTTKYVLFWMAGTCVLSDAQAGNRGFNAVENDMASSGEIFANPNAETYARGQMFNDRMYTIKTHSVVTLPYDMKVGVIGRYQDGQPFSRMVIVPDLNQGTEMIRSFATGRSRFTFRATLDVRVTKRITMPGGELGLFLEGFNLLNHSNEVEEYVVTGPRFRETTAVQPPRSFHLGARITF